MQENMKEYMKMWAESWVELDAESVIILRESHKRFETLPEN